MHNTLKYRRFLVLACVAISFLGFNAKHAEAAYSSANTSSQSGNPNIMSATVNTGDTLLCAMFVNGASWSLTSASYDGVAMTAVFSDAVGPYGDKKVFCIENPDVGTHDISVAYSGGSGGFWSAYETMTDAGMPTNSNASFTSSGSSLSASITMGSADSWLLSFVMAGSDSTSGLPSFGSGATRRSNCCNIISVGDSDGPTGTGAYGSTYTVNSGGTAMQLEIPVAGTPTTTPAATSTSETCTFFYGGTTTPCTQLVDIPTLDIAIVCILYLLSLFMTLWFFKPHSL